MQIPKPNDWFCGGGWALAVLLSLLSCGPATPSAKPVVRLSAAASLGPVLEKLRPEIEAELGIKLQLNLAGSGTLARQILDGAPADAVVLAHPDWIARLTDAGLIDPERVEVLAGNRLVVVGRQVHHNTEGLSLVILEDLVQPTVRRITVGDPAAVPVGRYAEQALRAAGVWDQAQSKLIPAVDARAAYNYAVMGEADVAIVYASDVHPDDEMMIYFQVATDLHDTIQICGAATAESEQGQRLIDWLNRASTQEALVAAGFLP